MGEAEAEHACVPLPVQEAELPGGPGPEALLELRAGEGCQCAVQGGQVPTPLLHEGVDRLLVGQSLSENSRQGLVDPRPVPVPLESRLSGLDHHYSAWVQPLLDELEALFSVQGVARPVPVRIIQRWRVHDHDIKFVLVVLQVGPRVRDHNLQPRIGESALVLLQVLLAKIHHRRVHVGHHALLDAGVTQHLTCRCTLPTTADEHALGALVVHHGRVHQGLVVHERIQSRGGHQAIHHQCPAEGLEIKQLNGRVLGLLPSQDLFHLIVALEPRLHTFRQHFAHGGRAEAGLQKT
mmetsp:Transcript_22901/g.55407  ORF Transcript_22901/g.55407 Transcript_22901/m.55407 type:complete len:294 (-) Transcript_22901:7-888(-)